jgi:hypothetical protein
MTAPITNGSEMFDALRLEASASIRAADIALLGSVVKQLHYGAGRGMNVPGPIGRGVRDGGPPPRGPHFRAPQRYPHLESEVVIPPLAGARPAYMFLCSND